MKIDATRFKMFWDNPERYRLREIWGIDPIEPKAGTAERKRAFGRFRGIAFHDMMDGLHAGVSIEDTTTKLLQRGFTNDEVEAAAFLAKGARDRFPDEKHLVHEAVFEYPIAGSNHSLVGRVDHILNRDGEILVGDWKTSSFRSNSHENQKGNEYCRQAQVDFYLLGATILGYQPTGFIYRLVSARDPKQSERDAGNNDRRVEIVEFRTNRTARELRNFERAVMMTCDLITYWTEKYNAQAPWPVFEEKFPTGFESRFGLPMYHNFVPEGFERKREHLSLMENHSNA